MVFARLGLGDSDDGRNRTSSRSASAQLFSYTSIGRETANIWTSPAHPNLQLSPEERRYFGQLFSAADTDKIGVVTGEVAVKFFEKTKLPPSTLGEVCDHAELTMTK